MVQFPWAEGEWAHCKYCEEPIYCDGQGWLDETNGDVCSGDNDLVNENESHVPE